LSYWPFWASGLALALVMVTHLLVTERQMAVSGRFTALVNRLRFGPAPELGMEQAELLEAIRAATLEQFGPDAVTTTVTTEVPSSPAIPARAAGSMNHLLFFASLLVGGALSRALRGGVHPSLSLTSERLAGITAHSPLRLGALLALGGVCIGFGTRMAGGCTSGHGLCGVSRFQRGSAVATAAFFGAGIAVSFALELL